MEAPTNSRKKSQQAMSDPSECHHVHMGVIQYDIVESAPASAPAAWLNTMEYYCSTAVERGVRRELQCTSELTAIRTTGRKLYARCDGDRR
jgi:hypothetical protein